jgi:DNA (cytosine-5)-methyltransferase 1
MMDKKHLTLGSLFDGSGGFPLGGILAGIEPRWSSEIEPFPVLVTHKRLPQVQHYGDVSTLNGAELPPVDIITFGSPCQDLSIAGKRAGIHDGDRSNLFFQAIRIIKEMRDATNGRYPRYCVWENVPGAFSSNGGNDFKAVLEAVIGVKEKGIEVPAPENHRWAKSDVYLGDGWSVAYRVFDAQYWGVPQRRARIYLVADFAGESAGEILFKSEGVSGYTPQGFRAWQGAAGGAEEGTGETGGRSDAGGGTLCLNTQGNSGVGITEDKALALVAQDHGNHPAVLAAGFSTEHSAKARSIGYEEEVSPTLRAGVVPAALSVENHPTDGRVKIREDDTCQTLCSRAGTGGNNVPLVAEPITLKIRSGCEGGGKGALWQTDKSATLATNNNQTLFQPEIKAFGVCSKHSNAMMSDNPHSGFYEATTSRTLDQSGGNSVTSNQGGICVVAPAPETFDVRFTSDGTKNARGHCYPTDISRCLDTNEGSPDSNHGGVAVVALEPGAASRVGGHVYSDGKSGTLRANAGDNQQAVVVAEPETYALQGSMIGRADKNGPQGDGINEDVCFTLNTSDRHAIAAPDPSFTISRDNHFAVSEDISVTAVARGPATVAAPADHYCTSKNSHHTVAVHEQANTLVASDWKDPPLVNDLPNDEPVYIVRRLTPVECARLQGFPDWWCADLAIPDPSDEEIAFWMEVWETWRQITNPKGKPKTEKQIRKWLANPYTDSAEYKLWGNGVSEPVVFFVLSGIAWAAQNSETNAANCEHSDTM